MKRQPHADRLLCRWASALVGTPLVWGATDCHALCRRALELQFDADMVPMVPRWFSKREALEVLRTWDIVTACRLAGAVVLPPDAALTGDLIIEPPGPRWRASWVALATQLFGADPKARKVVLLRRPPVWLDGTLALRFPNG